MAMTELSRQQILMRRMEAEKSASVAEKKQASPALPESKQDTETSQQQLKGTKTSSSKKSIFVPEEEVSNE